MIGALDARDVPLDAMAYSENLNPIAIQGRLGGIEADQTFLAGASATGSTSASRSYTIYKDGTRAVYYDGTNLREITGIGTTLVNNDLGAFTSTDYASAVSDGKAVHIGLGDDATAIPRWVGEIDYGQFGDPAPTGTQALDARLRRARRSQTITTMTFNNEQEATDSTEAVFRTGNKYFYFFTFQYDGYQEGPLAAAKGLEADASYSFFTVGPGGWELFATNNGFKSVDVNITVNDNSAEWSSRVSGIVVYRALSEGNPILPDNEPEFLRIIDINDASWGGTAGARTFTWTDDNNYTGATYSERTGIPPTVEDFDIHWQLSTTNDVYHFVGNAQFDEIPESSRVVYRSQPYKYNMFDWTRDFVVLQQTPSALASFAGRLFAFTPNRTFVIDPNTLDVADTWEGIGTYDQSSVVVTDRGMFFCNDNNIYVYDGNAVHPIGAPVLRNDVDTDAAWLSKITTNFNPVVLYDARMDAFIVAYVNASGNVSYLSYKTARSQTIDLPTGRWDHITTTATQVRGRLLSATGRPILGLGNDLVELFASTTKRAWTATLREIETPMKAKYYHVRIHGSPVTVEYSEDGGTFTSATLSLDGTGVHRADINGHAGRSWDRVNTWQLRLTGAAAQEVDMIDITRRLMART